MSALTHAHQFAGVGPSPPFDGRRPCLCESIGGAIRTLALFVPAIEARDFALSYTALIESLPQEASVVIVAESAALEHIARWPIDGAQLQIIEFADGAITAWARDPFLMADGSDGSPFLLASPELARSNDMAATTRLASALGLAYETSPVAFEGGNMLIGEDCFLVGPDSIDALAHPASIEDLVPPGRRLIVIGAPASLPHQSERKVIIEGEKWSEVFHYHNKENTRQPIFHIDMFVTLAGKDVAGKERVLVGDPRLAAEILGTSLHPRSLADAFDAIADDLAEAGLSVIRNPLPLIYMDEIEQRRRTWLYASSNNALVQRCEASGNIVWLPEYGHDNWPELAKTDAANRAIWEELGFEVRMIGQAQRLAENLGGLHCLTNVVRRG